MTTPDHQLRSGPAASINLTHAQRAFSVVREAMQSVMYGVRNAWTLIPDEIRQAAAAGAGLRYWTDQQGHTRRTAGMKPLLHNGRKP